MRRPDPPSIGSAARRRAQPTAEERAPLPSTLAPEVAEAMLAATVAERDRLLLRTLWATGARVGEVLALRPCDVQRDALLLRNVKDPRSPGQAALLGGAHAALPAELALWAREHQLADDEPLFFSRQRGSDGRRRAITRQQAWHLVSAAARLAQGAEHDAVQPRPAASGPRTRASAERRPNASTPAPQTGTTERARPRNVGPPLVRERLVSRPHLLQRLDGVLRHPVTLIAAPAGFGKTTTLATWEAQVRERLVVAWVSLGIGDNDPVRFWRDALVALQAQQPALGASASARLQGGAPIAAVVDDLLTDLAELAVPLALVLDDYHVIETPAVHSSVAALLSECPPGFHLVLSTRADPPLPLARMRSLGQLLEVRAAQLSFTEDEATGLLDDALGVALSPTQVAVLAARTEGWAAGLHLAALSLRAQADLPTALAAFAGSDRSIVDYFAEEILDHLPNEARVFLERTSILERMCPALCDAVVGEPGSGAVLDVLERGNVFVTPVDQGRQWFRYHQLFADTLRHRLERDEPGLLPTLHERASAWYEAHELLDDALEHALSARQWDRAARLIQSQFRALMWRGEEMTLRRWLQAVPEDVRQRHPVLAHATATTLLMTGEAARLAAFLGAAEPQLEAAREYAALGVLLSDHAQLAVNTDDLDGALAHAGRALELLPPQPPDPYRAQALGVILQCHLLRGDPGAAGQFVEQLKGLTSAMRLVYWTHLLDRAEWIRQRGDLPRAAIEYRTLLDDTGERAVFARHKGFLGLAVVALEQNRLLEANDYLDRSRDGQRLAGRTYRSIQAAALVQRARVLRARERLAEADDALSQAENAAREQGSLRVERLARAERAWVALLDGRAADAERWASDLDASGLAAYAREPEVLVLARVRRAQGADAELRPLLEQLLAAAEQAGRIDSVISLLVQLALVHEQGGDSTGALAALERAVTLGEPGGYVRVFLDEGDGLLALLRRLLKHGEKATLATRLLAAFSNGAERGKPTAQLVTPRERDVLRLLALGLPNRVIAERLVTSEATIKSHVHHLIEKLGVANRAEVLVRARELGELQTVSRPGGAD